ncbi:ATPase [Brevibacillus sp. SYSU BS000544]|uniref:ATPase n=1 Tax=Brevibacillus sp. SYSU BS000544 TaxID=3416443 RepID=UPI003CE5A2E5
MATRDFSTGPLENFVTNNSQRVRVKILNNSSSTITARVRVFRLNGTKTRTFSETVTVPSNSSEFVEVSVSSLPQFEVQIRVSNGDSDLDKVLVSVFGITLADELNPSHRVLHKELKRI